jgi:DNA-binding transcriptional LysR family regulator
MLRRYEQLLGEVRSAADSIRGVLRVGTIYSVGFYMLAPFIRRFLKSHPDVNLHIDYTRWDRIYSAVVGGEMDLGIVACPERHRSVEVIPLASEELVMVCAPTHRLAAREAVDPCDLEGENFVAFEANIPTQRLIDRLLKADDVHVNVTQEFDNIELLKRAVEVDTGLSILPAGNVEREVAEEHLAAIPFRRPSKWVRPVAILRHRGKAPGPAERIFLAILRSKP